jgi:predicted transcriptional regulator
MSLNINTDWKVDAINLAETGDMSWRSIARELGVAKSTVSDFLREYYKEREKVDDDVEAVKRVDEMYPETAHIISNPLVDFYVQEAVDKETVSYESVFKIATDKTKQEGTHLFIPDVQAKEGVDFSHLAALGNYIVHKKPDVIINIGDFADMESLSSWDKGKKSAEGKRVIKDINAAIEAMWILLEPLYNFQQAELEEFGEIKYKPRMVLCLGNHEDRITRHVNSCPELDGFLGIHSLKYEEFGWEVYPFLTPVTVGGIAYCHYFQNVMTGKPMTGTAANMLSKIARSFSMGHRQVLDIATRYLQIDGEQQFGLIAGAFYMHEEDYKGRQGNHHWRGIVVKHNVKAGSYNPMMVSIDWLLDNYGDKNATN